jgi:phage tail sheath protein FI
MSVLSPDVNIKELDFSGIVPTVATTQAAIAGKFSTGPLNVPVLISSEDELVATFGKPNETNYMEWHCAAEFLKYSASLYVTRATPVGVLNATFSGTGFLIDNEDTFHGMTSGNKTTTGIFAAKNAGISGNDLGVLIVDSAGWTAFKAWAATITTMPNAIPFDAYFTAAPGTSVYVSNLAVNQTEAKNDEVHVLVFDATGNITGTKYSVLEKFEAVSKAVDAADYTGNSTFALTKINLTSKYVWMTAFPSTSTSSSTSKDPNTDTFATDIAAVGYDFAAFTVTSAGATYSLQKGLAGGVAGTLSGDTEMLTAYSKYANKDLIDVGHIITAGHTAAVIAYCAQTLAAGRKDAMSYNSVYHTTVGTPIKDTDTAPESLAVACKASWNIAEMDAQYTVTDTGYKYIYDKYNRKYRWIPMNGDVAGIAARLGFIAEEWYSPGGFNRGGLKNVVKLAFNPNLAQRDVIYPKGINPIVAFANQGVVLYGDRTGTLKPSAFDRYNVRRLFIILEKSIAIAAKYQLFEFNDVFTRAQFKNMVEPFLRTIQGKRGIQDFLVRCDEKNNTGQVIDSNQFVGEIYVKPARSINNITLTFVATRSDVQFSTIVTQ